MKSALKVLWALMVMATLTVLAAVLGAGCSGKKEDPIPLYGPPPADTGVQPAAVDAGRPDASCEPVALYGPQPCGSDSDCQTRMGAGWYCETIDYGTDGCGNHLTWPSCVQRAGVDAGAPAVDSGTCEPVALYGPPPCSTDDDCTTYGAGWYCDKTSAVNTGCQVTAWPMCKQAAAVDAGTPAVDSGTCDPVALYGPRPCGSDADCGDAGVCDKENTFPDGCGGQARWPVCK
ncbi:MAG TPA: hypothetical protein VGK67_04460 [Myxococcales bacterium]|jgi:hypothetical protein